MKQKQKQPKFNNKHRVDNALYSKVKGILDTKGITAKDFHEAIYRDYINGKFDLEPGRAKIIWKGEKE